MEIEIKERLLKYLYDAHSAAETIITDTYGLSVNSYQFNNIRWLVERGIEIISEALKRATYLQKDIPISNLPKIFSTRNKIAHEYDIIDPNILYAIVIKYLPILIEELNKFISDLEELEELS